MVKARCSLSKSLLLLIPPLENIILFELVQFWNFFLHNFGVSKYTKHIFSLSKGSINYILDWMSVWKLKQTCGVNTAPRWGESTWKQGTVTHPHTGLGSGKKIVTRAGARLSTPSFLPPMPRIPSDWQRGPPSLSKPPKVCAFWEEAATPHSDSNLLD